jgi:hypothetical protein
LKDVAEVDVATFRKVIEEQGVEIIRGKGARTSSTPRESKSTPTKHKLKKEGDFNNVIAGCPALQRLWEKTEEGQYKWELENPGKRFPHPVSLALLTLAINTKNGAEVLHERLKLLPGYDAGITEQQFQHAIDSDYKPHTCKAIQDSGLCKIGEHPRFNDRCLEKIPPKTVENGHVLINPDLIPESAWSDPSPIRFASEKHMPYDEIVKSVKELIVMKEKPADLVLQLQHLLKSLQSHPEEARKYVHDLVSTSGLIGKRDLKKLEKEAEKDRKNEAYQRKIGTLPTFSFQGTDYFMRDGKYWKSSLDAKGNRQELELTNFTIQIREELEVINTELRPDANKERIVKRRYFAGYVLTAEGDRFYFKENGDDFLRGPETFFSFVTKLCGSALHYKRNQYDDIRACVYHFSRRGDFRIRKKLEDFEF